MKIQYRLWAMSVWLLASCGMVSDSIPSAQAATNWQAFTYSDGAISFLPIQHLSDATRPKIDPYFANIALIVAHEGKLDVKQQTIDWLTWLLPRQREDGSFDRYCQNAQKQWYACASADADDSTAATTIQLIALSKSYLPNHLRTQAEHAAQKAQILLQRLRLPHGTYKARVATHAPVVEYLMDNTEVYAAWRDSGQTQLANELKSAIHKRFETQTDVWEPAYPLYDKIQFYPHGLAYTYRWHNGLADPAKMPYETANWLAIYGKDWFYRRADPYPWGIIAWGMREGSPIGARCWLAHAQPLKNSAYWTVLDQAVEDALLATGLQAEFVPAVCPK